MRGRCTGRHQPGARRRPRLPAEPAGVLHSEYVVSDGQGGFTTKMTQTGIVDEITLSPIVVRSDDGYTQIYAFPSSSVVPEKSVAAKTPSPSRPPANRPDGDPQPSIGEGQPPPAIRPAAVEITARSRQDLGSHLGSRNRRLDFGCRLLDRARLTQRHPGPRVGDDGRRALSSASTAVKVPIATTALAPIVADTSFSFLEFISDHSNSVSGEPPRPAGTAGRTVRREVSYDPYGALGSRKGRE